MRLLVLSLVLITTSCVQAATDLGWNNFYLNCFNEAGEPRKTFYIDQGRKQISELDETGVLYLVCDSCETLINDSHIKWTTLRENGVTDITSIDRRTGIYFSHTIDPNAMPVEIGDVSIPAELMSRGISLKCQAGGGPPERKF
jgi:hypothetical protein